MNNVSFKGLPLNRPQFIRRTGLTAGAMALPFVSARNVLGANSRLNIAAIGAGGKGSVDVGYCASENIVALCDVDEKNAAGSFKKFPNAKPYRDFRLILEKENPNNDAGTGSTPYPIHFYAAAMAMQ